MTWSRAAIMWELAETTGSSAPSSLYTDAILDVVVLGYGYLRAGDGQPWRPYANAQVRLVNAKDPTKILMDNRVAYNALGSPENVVNISANPDYSYEKFEDVVADQEKMVAGLRDAFDQLAVTIGTLLK